MSKDMSAADPVTPTQPGVFHVRSARASDSAAIRTLHLIALEEHRNRETNFAEQQPFIDPELERLSLKGRLDNLMCSMPGTLLVAEDKSGQIAGFTGFHLYRRVREVFVYDLVVDPEFRHRGVGQKLLAALEDETRKQGGTLVKVGTWPSNGASQALLTTCGYELTTRATLNDDDTPFVIASKRLRATPQMKMKRVMWRLLPYVLILGLAAILLSQAPG